MSTRTAAEKERFKQLEANVPIVIRAAHAKSVRELDLTLLPIETTFTVCVFDTIRGLGTTSIVAESNKMKVSDALDVKTNVGTLRQINHRNTIYSPTHGVLTLRMGLVYKGSARNKVRFDMKADGRSLPLTRVVFETAQLLKDGAKTRNTVFEKLENYAENFPFIGQHTLEFPATYFNRGEVTFLGLPAGTKVPLKNGGMFEVAHRRITSLTGHKIDGVLVMVALDASAKKLADKMGWPARGSHMVGASALPLYEVPPVLWTQQRNGADFDIRNIRVPYLCPLAADFPAVFKGYESTAAHILATVAAPARASGLVWRDDPEALAASLDDFLFG